MSKKHKSRKGGKSRNHNKAKKPEHQKAAVKHPMRRIMVRFGLLTLMIILGLTFMDKKGYFNPEMRNNHTARKWNSFYEMTNRGDSVDIMLFGNSHMYTGINPKNLSLALGSTAFVLASPGTSIADSYFSLVEAVKQCKPKLVVIETYGMNDFNPYELEEAVLTDQFKSFSARKDFFTKLYSTPFLFSHDNYIYAWSNTIRNHNYIFDNQKQLKKNKEIIKDNNNPLTEDELYLGRFVVFETGLEKDILEKYEEEGAPQSGADFEYSRYTEKYVRKIVEFCNEQDIACMFLTLPMYEKHVSDYEVWKARLSEVIEQHPNKWLDMQVLPGYKGFGPFAFENTYALNQHLTYQGSLVATYKLADYIRDSMSVELPSRRKDVDWHRMFYGVEGYFENYNPALEDQENIVLFTDREVQNIVIDDCIIVEIPDKEIKRIIAKVDKDSFSGEEYKHMNFRLLLEIELEGKEQVAYVDLMYDMLHHPVEEILFSSVVKPVKVKDVSNVMLITQSILN